MKFIGTFAAFCAVLGPVARGYDIACIYPQEWRPESPFLALASTNAFYAEFTNANKVETPVVVRTAHHATLCRGMCLAFHDEDVLDPIDLEPTFTTVPEFGQNGWSIIMCIPQCILHVLDGVFDFTDQAMAHFSEEFGYHAEHPDSRPDIYNAWVQKLAFNNHQPMQDIMEADDYHPFTMGHIAGMKVRYYADLDGWNHDGKLTYDYQTDSAVPCTGSCREYQDTTGYEPVADPRVHTYLSTDSNKYDCTGQCRRWQPLQEGDSAGSLKRQEFTMPHIGRKAKTYLREPTITLEDPEYDLYEESLLVIDRLRETTMDQYKRDAISQFDGKLYVRSIISGAIRDQFVDSRRHSFQ